MRLLVVFFVPLRVWKDFGKILKARVEVVLLLGETSPCGVRKDPAIRGLGVRGECQLHEGVHIHLKWKSCSALCQ